MLSVMGVADFAGKIVFGFMLDKFRSQSLTLTTVMLLLGAASVLGVEFWPGTEHGNDIGLATLFQIDQTTFMCRQRTN